MRDEDVKIGMRVVPHSESKGMGNLFDVIQVLKRAKNKKQEYLYVSEREFCSDVWAWKLNDSNNNVGGVLFKACEFEPYVGPELRLCSYLQDTNGRLIHQGDVLKHKDSDCDYFEVKFVDGAFETYRQDGRHYTDLASMCVHGYEIVGNVIDNPELSIHIKKMEVKFFDKVLKLGFIENKNTDRLYECRWNGFIIEYYDGYEVEYANLMSTDRMRDIESLHIEKSLLAPSKNAVDLMFRKLELRLKADSEFLEQFADYI